jgi:hypothetical protein
MPNCDGTALTRVPRALDIFGELLYDQLVAQGVVESCPLPFAAPFNPPGHKNWRAGGAVFIGASRGAIHYDYPDNVLIQMSGVKAAIVYTAELTRPLSVGGTEDRIPTGSILPSSTFLCNRPGSGPRMPRSRELVQRHARLAILHPGMGLLIPAGAYHAPVAMTHTSVSMASNLYPMRATDAPTWSPPLPNRHALALESKLRAFHMDLQRNGSSA